MRRVVQPELLDTLPPESPEARQSRLDLRRVNRLMGHPGRLIRGILPLLPTAPQRPWRILELGAGDAVLSGQIWNRLPVPPVGSQLVLLDQAAIGEPGALNQLEARGWKIELVKSDAFAWLEDAGETPFDVTYSNLFIHHFDSGALAELLRLLAAQTRAFITLEPRRGWSAQLGVRGLRWLGHHAVTLYDARCSVLAGFQGKELSRAWPSPDWSLSEGRAGLFSHRFIARRRPAS